MVPAEEKLLEKDFLYIEKELTDLGFKEIEFSIRTDFRKLDLEYPKEITGDEIGFEFTRNSLTVKVWIMYSNKTKEFTTDIAALILITQGDMAQFHSRPITQASGFLKKILIQTWIAQFKVKNRPLCKQCNKFMQITHNDLKTVYYWSCRLTEQHENSEPTYKKWDALTKEENLPQKAKKDLSNLRRRIATHNDA